MLIIDQQVSIEESEIEIQGIRAQGAGGQNVNKVASAVHLRFNIGASSLPQEYKDCLMQKADRRISKEGMIVIKAQQHRTRERNREAAIERLITLIQSAVQRPKARTATKPSRRARQKRLDAKRKRSDAKVRRKRIAID